MRLPQITKEVFVRDVQGTPKGALVADSIQLITRLTKAAQLGCQVPASESRVYIKARVIKHMYDKRPAEEFDKVVQNLERIFRYPDRIYENKNGKRGDLVFVKKIGNDDLIAIAEVEILEGGDGTPVLTCVTAFRIDQSYLEDYKLLWTWKGDIPSS